MAKGFTVKAKTPTVTKEPEWDYAKAREMIKGKTVVFCLPGSCLLYTSPSPRDATLSRMPSSA